jgi:type II secretory pathway pseudopilin PulG
MYGAPQYTPPANLKTGAALASMILGIVGFFTLGGFFIGSIVGLILGISALRKSRKMPGEYGGGGFAIAGIVLNAGFLVLGTAYIALVAMIAVPNLLAARRSANMASAKQTLRIINSAQAVYQSGIGEGNYAASLSDLGGSEGLLDSTVVNARTTPKSGYLLGEMKATPATRTEPAKYSITAFPAVKDGTARSGDDCFFVDETGVIRHSGSPDKLATADSPPID